MLKGQKGRLIFLVACWFIAGLGFGISGSLWAAPKPRVNKAVSPDRSGSRIYIWHEALKRHTLLGPMINGLNRNDGRILQRLAIIERKIVSLEGLTR